MADDRPPNTGAMLSSRRCGAKTRLGAPCPGARGAGKNVLDHGAAPGKLGVPRGTKNAPRTHGPHTREAIEERRRLRRALLRRKRCYQATRLSGLR